MITWTGWDVAPEALIIPEAVCDVCGIVAGTTDTEAMVVQVEWSDGAVTPPLIIHKDACDAVLGRAVAASGGFDSWHDLAPWVGMLARNVTDPPTAGTTRDGETFQRRHPRPIDLRRTADLLDAVAAMTTRRTA